MTDIGIFEAKNKLSSLLDRIEQGEEITITRRGKRVAKLVAFDAAETGHKRSPREAADNLRKLSKGLSLGGIPLKSLIEDGRK